MTALLCPLCPNKNTIGTDENIVKTTYKCRKNNERVKYTCQHLGKYKFEIPICVYIVNNGENCHDNCKIKYIEIYLIRKVGRRKKSEHERKIQFCFKYCTKLAKKCSPPPTSWPTSNMYVSCNSVIRFDYPFQNNLKNLNPWKMDLDSWDGCGSKKHWYSVCSKKWLLPLLTFWVASLG